jgi:hypothetical protein
MPGKTVPFKGLAVNVGRSASSGGEHREHMMNYVDKMPARGTTGPGKMTKGENALHGGKYATGGKAAVKEAK